MWRFWTNVKPSSRDLAQPSYYRYRYNNMTEMQRSARQQKKQHFWGAFCMIEYFHDVIVNISLPLS